MNNNVFEISFSELRCKEVVNASDGRRLGKITDIIFSGETGRIKGIVTPYVKRGVFGKGQEVFIPWRCVKKLGEDVIIVEIGGVENNSASCSERREPPIEPPPPPPPPFKAQNTGMPSCDGRCEKCMLFDCEQRWKNS